MGPESGHLPRGESTSDTPEHAPLTGVYYKLPEGTSLLSGLAIIADGNDVNPNSSHGEGHYTIFPTEAMTVDKFNVLIKSLPWERGGRKK